MMMTMTDEELVQNDLDKMAVLNDLIIKNDRDAVIELMTQYQKDCVDGTTFYAYITHPPIITELHKLIVEHMGVNQKNMQLRRRIDNRKRRAQLFLQAMMNGISMVNTGE